MSRLRLSFGGGLLAANLVRELPHEIGVATVTRRGASVIVDADCRATVMQGGPTGLIVAFHRSTEHDDSRCDDGEHCWHVWTDSVEVLP